MKITEKETKRLLISPITLSDLEDIHRLHSLPETDKFNTLGIPASIIETETIITEWIEKNNSPTKQKITLRIELIDNKDFIGLIGLNLGEPKFRIGEVWYKLHSDYWNNGYATEAVNMILDYGFNDLNLHRIEAGCAVENIASSKVLEKVGMTKEGRKRKVLPLKNGWSDNFLYAILSEDKRNLVKKTEEISKEFEH